MLMLPSRQAGETDWLQCANYVGFAEKESDVPGGNPSLATAMGQDPPAPHAR
jgi:hypothetical protein